MAMETAEVLEAIRGDIRRVATTLSTEINELRHDLRLEILEGRRHTDVLFESLHDDIRLVAEGLAVVSAKLDRLPP
jgi:ribosome assembly protein YihI (activator of Der GTPase)